MESILERGKDLHMLDMHGVSEMSECSSVLGNSCSKVEALR